MRILIAPNSFKECADSTLIASLIQENLKNIFSKSENIVFEQIPISDGGDGFLEICKHKFNAESKYFTIPDPANLNEFRCEVAYSPKLKTIFIESAKALGLNIVKPRIRNPLKLNSAGLGKILSYLNNKTDKINFDIEKVIIGIGGTATSDTGIGMASEFNLKLYNENKSELDPFPVNFPYIRDIFWKMPKLIYEIEAVIDVDNLLTGEFGAAKVYAKQKGASEDDIQILENGTLNFIKVFSDKYGVQASNLKGAGGGLAAGFQLFFNANLIPSNMFINEFYKFNDNLKYDFVITGEGSFDSQSIANKGTKFIIDKFKNTSTVIVVTGKLNLDNKIIEKDFKNVYFIELSKYFKEKNGSLKYFDEAIRKAAIDITNIIKQRNVSGA